MFSPAIELDAGLTAVAADWHKFYSLIYTRGKWIDIAPDGDFAKYESFAKNAGDQVFELTKKRILFDSELTVPVFIAISKDDATINPEATIEFFKTKLNAKTQEASRLLVYHRAKEEDQDYCNKKHIVCIESDTEESISSFSHTALPVSSDNFHYGKKANYFNCIHYIKDKENEAADSNYKLCKENSGDIEYAELVSDDAKVNEKITDQIYRRLTYNPDFDNMMSKIDEFVKKIH